MYVSSVSLKRVLTGLARGSRPTMSSTVRSRTLRSLRLPSESLNETAAHQPFAFASGAAVPLGLRLWFSGEAPPSQQEDPIVSDSGTVLFKVINYAPQWVWESPADWTRTCNNSCLIKHDDDMLYQAGASLVSPPAGCWYLLPRTLPTPTCTGSTPRQHTALFLYLTGPCPHQRALDPHGQ